MFQNTNETRLMGIVWMPIPINPTETKYVLWPPMGNFSWLKFESVNFKGEKLTKVCTRGISQSHFFFIHLCHKLKNGDHTRSKRLFRSLHVCWWE